MFDGDFWWDIDSSYAPNSRKNQELHETTNELQD